MGVVVQFKPKNAIPAAPLSCQSTTIHEKGGGPSFDPGAFGVFLDRARRKRNACLQLRSTRLSSQPLTPICPGAASRTSVPAQPTETP
jgi:hypothetical protein